MSFTKLHRLPSNGTTSVYRVQQYRVDYNAREASAIVSAYCDAVATVPLIPVFAKLRLTGDRFDATLGKARLRGSRDINACLYEALTTDPVVSDAGPDFFKDAEAT